MVAVPLMRDRVHSHWPKALFRAFGPLGNDEAQLLQLPMGLGRAPIRVLFRQAPDQHANLSVDLGPASAEAGAPAPVEAEPGAMLPTTVSGLTMMRTSVQRDQ